ncbi:MAG TPA: acetyl-CoA carboxylase biotin carboxyl carrier protein [Nitrosopumilus sp.]|nr:acetyl-CoA carboxylase biotin carboxyl carrier protein [Nitrosopumilus sp.]
MRIKEIQNLIKFVAKSGASEVTIEMEKLKLTIKTGSNQTVQETVPVIQPLAITQPQPVQPEEPQDSALPEEDSKYVTITSPIIGTFYRKPSPDKPAFVEMGDSISEGSVLCVIEAMKLFNEIESEVSGKIVKVLVEDSTPVEFDQPLFLIDPS